MGLLDLGFTNPEATSNNCWLAYILDKVDSFLKPCGNRKITNKALYAKPNNIKTSSHVKYFHHFPPMWTTSYPKIVFVSDTMLGCIVTIYHIITRGFARVDTPTGIRGVRPTNLQIMSVDLHIHLINFKFSQNRMVVEGLPTKYYMQVGSIILIM